jgi:hypothetical protein
VVGISPSRNQPEEPTRLLPSPKAIANPNAQNITRAIERLTRVFAMIAPAFFMRESPVSNMAKPACMNSTRTAAMTTHNVLMALVSSAPSSCAAASAGTSRRRAATKIGTRRKALNLICAPRE